ncbi:uncharacterized protein [Neodiprion pinetum]|uniref:uncharacterized protein n=1 Tax=Neodiprion pinetum TaxID=441929 RepID=UPI003714461D
MSESLTLTLSGTSSVLEAQYFPPIELSLEKNYVLGLVEFLTFNSIPNIHETCNKFYLKRADNSRESITIPTGSYEIEDIQNFSPKELPSDITLSLKANDNELNSEVTCNHVDNDEIHIVVQHQDLCLLPSKSSLHIHEKITKGDGVAAVTVTKLINMAVCHLFEEVHYELNGVEIDRNKNVGITSAMKGYVSLSPGQQYSPENTGWLSGGNELTDAAGNFDVVLPLNYVLSFAEDYRRVIVNGKHDLILTRSNIDLNAVIQASHTENFKITLNKIKWLLPYIKLADKPKIQLLNYIAKDPAISMSFRSWETRNELLRTASEFDHCRIRDVKLFLNSQCYPYGNMNLDIYNNQYAILHDMYVRFQMTYYNKEAEPLLSKREFINRALLIVIDCSKQNETLKTGPVDIRLEFYSSIAFPPHTSAYCMILHDRIVECNPISGTVKKLV